MMERTYTTRELVDQLFANLQKMAPVGVASSYSLGYLYNTLAEIAEGGVDRLVEHVDWTNQRVEALEKVQ